MKRHIAVVAAISVIALGAAGCAKGESSGDSGKAAPANSSQSSTVDGSGSGTGAFGTVEKKVSTYGFNPSDEVATSRVDYFKSKHPDIDLSIDKNGFDQQKFLTSYASGNVADAVVVDRELVLTYAAKGMLQPLDQCFTAAGVDPTALYYPEELSEITYNGHIYGFPDFMSTRMIFVNTRVAEKAGLKASDIDPSDWDKFAAAAKAMYKSSGGKPTTIGVDPKMPEFLFMWALANGASIIAPDGKPNLDDPKVIEAVEYTAKLVEDQGGWANFKSFRDTWDFFGEGNEFAKDQVGAMPYEEWYVNVLAEFASKLTVEGVPFKDRQGNNLTFETGSAWTVTSKAKNPGAACQLGAEMTSTEAWAQAAKARSDKLNGQTLKGMFTGLFTGNKVADEQIRAEYVKSTGNAGFDSLINGFYDSMSYAKAMPPSPVGQQIKEAYSNAVTKVLGGADAASAMKTAQTEAMTAYNQLGK